jgi:hypothetical protein
MDFSLLEFQLKVLIYYYYFMILNIKNYKI